MYLPSSRGTTRAGYPHSRGHRTANRGAPRRSIAVRQTTTAALVVRVVPYGEADAIVTLFTEALGKVGALARRARSNAKKLAGSLDSLHTIAVRLDERAHAELAVLAEATIVRPRLHVL